jgi:hypothetical protein
MIQKIQDAVVDMMKKVKFIDEGRQHRYETIDGVWLQGVSTVSSIVPKDWLSAWGAKEAVKALGYSDYNDTKLAEEVLEKIKACKTIEEYIAILKEAKGASARKSKEALVDGTKGHKWLEDYVKAKIRNTELPEIPTDFLERPIKQFIEWAESNVKQWILSEALVAYPEKEYAGTLDGMAIMKDDKLALIDFKFASHISEDYYLQTAGYQAAFEPYGINIDERIIVRLPKTLTKEEYDEKERKYKIIDNNIEVEKVANPYEFDRDTFFHCLPVKKWINYVTKGR